MAIHRLFLAAIMLSTSALCDLALAGGFNNRGITNVTFEPTDVPCEARVVVHLVVTTDDSPGTKNFNSIVRISVNGSLAATLHEEMSLDVPPIVPVHHCGDYCPGACASLGTWHGITIDNTCYIRPRPPYGCACGMGVAPSVILQLAIHDVVDVTVDPWPVDHVVMDDSDDHDNIARVTFPGFMPKINGATVETRTFNDCSLSTLTVTNNYPASISITDVMDPLCVGFANLHSFSFSSDGGATAAVFNNNSNFRFSGDFNIEGPGEGEGGLRLSPWYGQYVDGRLMANATTGEIACFGGAIPFYSFTANHGITYTNGTTIHLELTYRANDLDADHPASIQYRVVYNGNTYDSPVLNFGEQNEMECVHGLWGMLNDGRAGGYFQPRANTGAALTATWSNVFFEKLPAIGTPCANGATIETRTFNDCPLSTLTSSNNYPSSI